MIEKSVISYKDKKFYIYNLEKKKWILCIFIDLYNDELRINWIW